MFAAAPLLRIDPMTAEVEPARKSPTGLKRVVSLQPIKDAHTNTLFVVAVGFKSTDNPKSEPFVEIIGLLSTALVPFVVVKPVTAIRRICTTSPLIFAVESS